MNIALSGILLFFILLPGLAYRWFYFSEEFSKQYFRESFTDTLLSSFVPSLLFHSAWFYLIQLFNYEVDLVLIGRFISNDDPFFVYENLQANFLAILIYQVSIILSACVLGFYSKNLLRITKLDRRVKFFRFKNSWHYFLKGELFDFPRATLNLENDKVEDIELAYVDVLVRINEMQSLIYEGILVDYELSNKGDGLETILLK